MKLYVYKMGCHGVQEVEAIALYQGEPRYWDGAMVFGTSSSEEVVDVSSL